MKKMISLIALALVATVVVSGCKGYQKCEDAHNMGQEVCMDKKQFDVEVNCEWKSAGDAKDDKKGQCNTVVDVDAAKKTKCAAVKFEAGAEAGAKNKDCNDVDPKCKVKGEVAAATGCEWKDAQ